jgi:hypothetical protein
MPPTGEGELLDRNPFLRMVGNSLQIYIFGLKNDSTAAGRSFKNPLY